MKCRLKDHFRHRYAVETDVVLFHGYEDSILNRQIDGIPGVTYFTAGKHEIGFSIGGFFDLADVLPPILHLIQARDPARSPLEFTDSRGNPLDIYGRRMNAVASREVPQQNAIEGPARKGWLAWLIG